jgi:hypothetical protein
MHNVQILISNEKKKKVIKTSQTGMRNDNAHSMLHGRKEEKEKGKRCRRFRISTRFAGPNMGPLPE